MRGGGPLCVNGLVVHKLCWSALVIYIVRLPMEVESGHRAVSKRCKPTFCTIMGGDWTCALMRLCVEARLRRFAIGLRLSAVFWPSALGRACTVHSPGPEEEVCGAV